MADALELMGLDCEASKWIAGTADKGIKEKLKQAWDNSRLYGKRGKQVKRHVTELHSPPRVNSMIERMGLAPGFSLDLTTNDPEDNQPWDFNKEEKRNKAEGLVKSKAAVLMIVSPMCAAFSRLQELNFPRTDARRVREILEYGTCHLEWCMRLCKLQHEQGLYFLFEHPATARSWGNKRVQEVRNGHEGSRACGRIYVHVRHETL